MKSTSFILALALGLFIISCSRSKSDEQEKAVASEEVSTIMQESEIEQTGLKREESMNKTKIESAMHTNAAVVNKKDTLHQFVRTADLKFKVNDVIEATYAIENIIARQNGFVTYTNMHSQVNEVFEMPLGHDSILETTKFTIQNNMVIRVPNTHLDTALKSMAHLVEFLDFRIIKADDVALQLTANRLAHARNNASSDRLTHALASQQGKLNDINAVDESINNRQALADEAHLQNLALREKIQYSTINIELYQRPCIKRAMVINDKNMGAYEPSLALKVWQSLSFGWHILEAFLLFIFKFWPLAILGLIAYFMVKKFGK